MHFGYWSRSNIRFGFIGVAAIFISGVAPTFGNEFVDFSNAQESNSGQRESAEIIHEIRSILNQTLVEYQNENFSGASALVDEAYLENYELVQDVLAEKDMSLMEEIGIQFRGQLRDQVNGTDPDADVPRIIAELNINLEKAESLLASKTENNRINRTVELMMFD